MANDHNYGLHRRFSNRHWERSLEPEVVLPFFRKQGVWYGFSLALPSSPPHEAGELKGTLSWPFQ